MKPRNSRYSEIADSQLSMSAPLQKRLWKCIVKQKIGYSTAVGLFNSVVSLVLVLIANKLSRTYTDSSMF